MKNEYLTPCQPTGFFTFFPSMVLQLFGYVFKVTFYWEISVCLNLLICPCSKLYGETQSSLPPDFGIQGKRVIPFPIQVSYWKISFFILGKLSPLEKLLEHREVGTTKCVWVDVHFFLKEIRTVYYNKFRFSKGPW